QVDLADVGDAGHDVADGPALRVPGHEHERLALEVVQVADALDLGERRLVQLDQLTELVADRVVVLAGDRHRGRGHRMRPPSAVATGPRAAPMVVAPFVAADPVARAGPVDLVGTAAWVIPPTISFLSA